MLCLRRYHIHPLYIEDVLKLEVSGYKSSNRRGKRRSGDPHMIPMWAWPIDCPPLPLQRQQPRFYKYGDHYFFIMPLLRLVNNSEEKFRAFIPGAKRMKGIQIEKSHLAIFASGKRVLSTMMVSHDLVRLSPIAVWVTLRVLSMISLWCCCIYGKGSMPRACLSHGYGLTCAVVVIHVAHLRASEV